VAKHIKASVILRLISGILLLLAIGSHPYSYYTLLRWIVSGTSFFTAWTFSMNEKRSWTWTFSIIGILFNPIAPVYLDKSTWQLIDVVTSLLFFASLKRD
jgi:hypothetical protein